jgi:alpha-galactosidase
MKTSIRAFFLSLGFFVALASVQSARASAIPVFFQQPTSIRAVTALGPVDLKSDGKSGWFGGDILVTADVTRRATTLRLTAPQTAVKHLLISWTWEAPVGGVYLGDAWERAYGDLQWKTLDTNRLMPWYFLVYDGTLTHGVGVKTGPAAMCAWKVAENKILLDADVRSGGVGVELGERTLTVCQVVSRVGQVKETPFQAAQAFCRQMCPKPLMPKQPVYGFNDWYCSYGNSTAEKYLADAEFIVSMAPAGKNRPFAVIDDGWEKTDKDDPAGTGFWDGTNPRFGTQMTMAEVATRIRKLGARPGIWVRPLIASPNQPKSWRMSRDAAYLDPTIPEVRAYVRQVMARLSDWGYELIKHDYTTFDISGIWGFQMVNGFTAEGWSFADRSHTTAEIILGLYRDIREGAGRKTLVLGCNTVGHLAAGLVELQRVGDDTSGKEWDRTRKMGVNCVAFRAPQHGTFFAIDGDCVGQVSSNSVPWDKNKQWLDLVARSGTALFISFPKSATSPEQEIALRAAMQEAAASQPVAQPLDWLDGPVPSRWKLDGEDTRFNW